MRNSVNLICHFITVSHTSNMWIKSVLLLFSIYCFVSGELISQPYKNDRITYHLLKVLNENTNVTKKDDICARQVFKVIHESLNGKQWALNMLDASSKLPSGLLEGNIVDLGSFDECLAVDQNIIINNEKHDIVGKFCLISTPLKNLIPGMKSAPLHRLGHVSNLTFYPETRVVNLVSASPLLTLSICMPRSCNENYFNEMFQNASVPISISSCQTKEYNTDITPGDWGFIAFLIIIIVFMVLSTIYDVYLEYAKKRPAHLILVAFSVYSNGKKLISTNVTPNQLPCLNGIRFLSMMWVILGHSFYTLFYSPTINTIAALEWMKDLANMTIIGATVSVDTFFVLGGLVMVYVFLMAYDKGIKMNVPLYYLHRYIRLTPALAVAMVGHITIIRFFGSGPYWPTVMKALEVNCSKWWWSVLLYVQNYVNPNEQCMGQTWYLSVDMQLFLISPLILFPLGKWPIYTIWAVIAGIVLSVISPFTIAYIDEMPGLIPIASANKYFMKMYYMNTYARFGPWLVGIVLGYFVHTRKENTRLNKLFENKLINTIGWVLSIVVLLLVTYAPNTMFYHEYNRVEASIFLGMHRVAWGIGLCWITYACIIGHGGIVNWFLSIPPFQILSRLTYSMYLIHLSMQFMKMGEMRVPKYFSSYNVINEFWGDFFFTLAIAVFWTLAFESPMIILEKIIFGGGKKPAPKASAPIIPTTENKE